MAEIQGTRRILRHIGALAGVFALSAIAAMSSAFAQANWNDVVAAAKKEGKVVIYNGTNFPVVKKLGELFEKEYGISVDVFDGRASEIRERIRTEQASGRAIGDLIYSGATSIALQTKEGAFQAHPALPRIGDLAEGYTPNGTFVPANAGNFAVLINTKLVSDADAPKSWKDLADPKWAGKILSDDPRALGGAQVWFEATLTAFGREYHEKMAAQKPVFSREWAESNRRIARGEFPIYIPFNMAEFQSLKGLPIRPLVPEEGVPYVQFGGAMLKDAPRKNAAALFLNWMLEPDRQLYFATYGYRPAAKGLAARIPPELRPLTEARMLGTTTPGRTDELLALAKEIYK